MSASILIVDDSPIPLNLHSSLLERQGHRCLKAQNGYLALEKLALNHCHLVITDVNMPRMDGYELCRRIRALPEHVQTPIIIVSTEAESKDRLKGLEAGANVYITKPAQPAALIAQVGMLLSGRA